MQPFKKHTGTVALLDRGNVDTDQIISKEFLKSIHRTGFGPHLFHDWRYLADGTPDPSFELNNKNYDGATLLVTGNNFGCGSSREHAVWAIMQYGFAAVIAPSKKSSGEMLPGFADIFRNNSGKNGLLTIELSQEKVEEIKVIIKTQSPLKATVDLPSQTLTLHTKQGDRSFEFPVDPSLKQKLMEGLDDIGETLRHVKDIDTFEKKHSAMMYRP